MDAPGLKGKMARKAFADKVYNLKHHGTYNHAFCESCSSCLEAGSS